MTPTPATIKFTVGKPEILALAYAEGKPCQSRFSGDSLMYTTTTGDRFFVEPYFADRLRAAGVTVGMPIEICKVESVTGNRRTVDMQVRPLRNGASAVAYAPALGVDTGHTNPTPAPPPMPVRPPAPPPPDAPVNAQGESDGDLYIECFREAVRIAPELVAIAKGQGMHIAPGFEDLRCIATHLSMNRRTR